MSDNNLQLQIDELKKRLDQLPAYFGRRMTNALASPNFVKGSSGWLMEDNGNVEFANGTFRGKLVVDSLEQLKFVMNTNFETIDSWIVLKTGGRGSATLEAIGAVSVLTGDQANDEAGLSQEFLYGVDYSTEIVSSWTLWPQTPASTDFLTSFGSIISAFANEDAGWWYDSATAELRAYTRHNSVTTYTVVPNIDVSGALTYRVELDGGSTAKFYIDGVLKHTQTSNLPSGTDAGVIKVVFRTTSAVVKEVYAIDALYISERILP